MSTKLKAGLAIAKNGAIADLQPLRTMIGSIVDLDVLVAIAAEAKAGRRLLIGAVEMDSSDAYLFDLTKAAVQYDGGRVPRCVTAISKHLSHFHRCQCPRFLPSSTGICTSTVVRVLA